MFFFVIIFNVILDERNIVKLLMFKTIKMKQLEDKIEARTALSLSVGWENGPERGLKTVSFNP